MREMKIRAAQQERARQKNLEKTMASRKRAEVEEEPVTYVAPRIVGKKKILTVKNIKIVGLALVVILLLFAYVPQLKKAANNTISFLQYGSGYPDTDPRELNRILMLLQKHILVPKSPANLVTLKDTATLSKNQPFLSDAKDGDKLIVFPALHQAILYSPARDIIVNVGAVSQENDTNTNTTPAPSNAASSTAPVAATELSVEIRNGTKVPGMAGKLKTQLSGQGFNVINASTDPISTYINTAIFAPNISESRKADLQKLVSDLQAQIVYKLPTDEANTSADILIIYGAKSP